MQLVPLQFDTKDVQKYEATYYLSYVGVGMLAMYAAFLMFIRRIEEGEGPFGGSLGGAVQVECSRLTHSSKAPGSVSTIEPIKREIGFTIFLMVSNSTCTATARERRRRWRQ
jgi:hypothetical protein